MPKRCITHSMERIDFQSDLLHQELTAAVSQLRAKRDYTSENVDAVGIPAIIKHHTRLSIAFMVKDIGYNAAIYVPPVDANNPLVNDFNRAGRMHEGPDLIRALGGSVEGTVDRSKSRVGGVFEKIESKIIIGELVLKDRSLSDAEISAFILHEIGHKFSYFEMIGHYFRTNMVLAATSREFFRIKDRRKRVMILKEASKATGIEIDNFDELADTEYHGTIETVYMTEMARQLRSEMGDNIYDLRTYEQLADEFAARHGAARDLATGMSKFYKKAGESHIPLPIYFALEVAKLTAFTLVSIGLPPAGALIAWMNWPRHDVYDEPRVRIEKIKNQLLQRLKDRKLPDDVRKSLVEDVDLIDSLAKEINGRESFYRIFVESVVPSRRRQRRQKDIQIELEKLASSELYASAAKFELGASNANA